MLCVDEQPRVFEAFRAERYRVLCIFYRCTVVFIHATRYKLFSVSCASRRACEKFDRTKRRSAVEPCCPQTIPFMVGRQAK